MSFMIIACICFCKGGAGRTENDSQRGQVGRQVGRGWTAEHQHTPTHITAVLEGKERKKKKKEKGRRRKEKKKVLRKGTLTSPCPTPGTGPPSPGTDGFWLVGFTLLDI